MNGYEYRYLEPTNITEEKRYYGVSTWEGRTVGSKKLDTFPEFRDLLVIDKKFIATVRSELLKVSDCAKDPLLEAGDCDKNVLLKQHIARIEMEDDHPLALSKEARKCLAKIFHEQWHLLPNSKEYLSWSTIENYDIEKVVQLRTFENKQLIYLGMEIPHFFAKYMERIQKMIDQEMSITSSAEKEAIKKELQKAWFQAVARHQEFEEKANATSDRINGQFVSIDSLSL